MTPTDQQASDLTPEQHSLKDWAEAKGLDYSTLRKGLNYYWFAPPKDGPNAAVPVPTPLDLAWWAEVPILDEEKYLNALLSVLGIYYTIDEINLSHHIAMIDASVSQRMEAKYNADMGVS